MSRYPENGSWATAPLPLRPAEKVKFSGDRRWWTVRAVTEHFAALTRYAAGQPAGTRCYTVIDWRNGVRGPCNQSGQGWGDGTYTETECEQMLAEFEAGQLEVSQRKWLTIQIIDLTPAAESVPR